MVSVGGAAVTFGHRVALIPFGASSATSVNLATTSNLSPRLYHIFAIIIFSSPCQKKNLETSFDSAAHGEYGAGVHRFSLCKTLLPDQLLTLPDAAIILA